MNEATTTNEVFEVLSNFKRSLSIRANTLARKSPLPQQDLHLLARLYLRLDEFEMDVRIEREQGVTSQLPAWVTRYAIQA